MARLKTAKRRKRAQFTQLEIGIICIGLGMAFLIPSLLSVASPALQTFIDGLRMPGWLALGTGVVLSVRHVTLKRNATKFADMARAARANREPPPSVGGFNFAEPQVWQAPRAQPIRAKVTPPVATRQPATAWSAAVFAVIEWRRFEAVCEALFAQTGFQTRTESLGADGGVDIWLHSANAQGPAAVVRCKHWHGKAVGTKAMQAFFDEMSAHQLKRGTYATSSVYTTNALQFAKENGINALDGAALLALIATRTPAQRTALLAVAHEGEYWRPTCAKCGIKLVERKAAPTGDAFWGCSNYPRCKFKLAMPRTAL